MNRPPCEQVTYHCPMFKISTEMVKQVGPRLRDCIARRYNHTTWSLLLSS